MSPAPPTVLRMSPVLTACRDCGTPYERDPGSGQTPATCEECRPAPDYRGQQLRRGSREAAGYDSAWRRLSARARRIQPFCSDCGSPSDLTADHSPEAWKLHEIGLPIPLDLIDVVCRRCNSERGPARGDDARPRANVRTHRAELARLERAELEPDSLDALEAADLERDRAALEAERLELEP